MARREFASEYDPGVVQGSEAWVKDARAKKRSVSGGLGTRGERVWRWERRRRQVS
jgi:hypothetical protein